MGVNDRLFEPPAPDLAAINARIARLPPVQADGIRRAGDALAIGDLSAAQAALAPVLASAPRQPDALRLYGLLLAWTGNLRAAIDNFEAALRVAPDDAMGYWQFARVIEEAGDVDAAWRLRNEAVRRMPDSPMASADLGEHLMRHRRPAEAVVHLERAARLAPDYAPGLLTWGNALVACGKVEEGAAAIRQALAVEPAFAAAWLALADIKTVAATDGEVARMRALLAGGDIDESERTAIGFALGHVCEARGAFDEAYALLEEANARRKREIPVWDVDRFLTQTRRSEEVFARPHSVAADPRLGAEVIFIAGLPRSGTTLFEQILAAHPDVNGAGELGELAQVLAAESTRRRRQYPDWVPDATAADWQRLGQHYLQATAGLRAGHRRFTDKMPNNWQALGAIRSMLPGARVVLARRDPLENCWSCYKQFFPVGWGFTYDVEQLGLFWQAFDRSASAWAVRAPECVREQGYEALTQDPEREIRGLLDFCALPFDPACLAPHRLVRNVNTLSAAQVREPVYRPRKVTLQYGRLLDPLRRALGLPVWADAPSCS